MKTINIFIFVSITCTIMALSACKKFLIVDPPVTSITEQSVYESDASAIAVMTGLYATMSGINNSYEGLSSELPGTSLWLSLSSDDLALWGGINNEDRILLYQNNLLNNSEFATTFWSRFYSKIFTTNAVIEGVAKSNALNPFVRKQLLGEAKFIRALHYFYLVNLYNDVPLVKTTDYKINALLPRTSATEIYDFIIEDLLAAQEILSENFLDASLLKTDNARVRPTKWAALALLSRVYLYRGDYQSAELTASLVLQNNGSIQLINDNINNVFTANNREAIWQLQPVFESFNTSDARIFILPNEGLNDVQFVKLAESLVKSFESGDKRLSNWVGSVTDMSVTPSKEIYYAYKYKTQPPTNDIVENTSILRLAEQYLIRAEARAKLGNLDGSKQDLNIIRNRSFLQNTSANDQSSLLDAIFIERRHEFFTELGHRWFDIKRLGKVDQIMTEAGEYKGNIWKTEQQLFPIPLTELRKNPHLRQNAGY